LRKKPAISSVDTSQTHHATHHPTPGAKRTLTMYPNTEPKALPTCARSTIDLNPAYQSQAAMYNEPASANRRHSTTPHPSKAACRKDWAAKQAEPTLASASSNIAIGLVRSWLAAAALRLARRASDEHQGCASCAARLRRAAQQAQPALQGSSLSGRRTMQGKRQAKSGVCVCVRSPSASAWAAGWQALVNDNPGLGLGSMISCSKL